MLPLRTTCCIPRDTDFIPGWIRQSRVASPLADMLVSGISEVVELSKPQKAT